MAQAFGEGEMEGVVTGERGETSGYSAQTKLDETELFEEVSGHLLELSKSSAVGAELLKVVATPSLPSDFKFEKQFGSDELKVAGFGRMPFDNIWQVIVNALNGNESMAATLNANETDGVDLDIEVSVALFHAEYKLSLEKVPLLLSDKLSAQLRTATKETAALRVELKQVTADLREATDCDAAKQLEDVRRILDVATEEIELMALAKERSDALIAKLSEEISASKSRVAAERSAAEKTEADLREEIRIRDALIHELQKGRKKAIGSRAVAKRKTDTRSKAVTRAVAKSKRTSFTFQIHILGRKKKREIVITDPRKWDVRDGGKTATAKEASAQILMRPSFRGDMQITVVLEKVTGFIGIGITDDCRKELYQCCQFASNGCVFANGSKVGDGCAFGGWQSGDRLVIDFEKYKGKAVIRAPNGVCKVNWLRGPGVEFWFSVYSHSAGTKVRIE